MVEAETNSSRTTIAVVDSSGTNVAQDHRTTILTMTSPSRSHAIRRSRKEAHHAQRMLQALACAKPEAL